MTAILEADPTCELDDLAELDSLLAESTKLVEAKRAKQLGRKLSADHTAALEANLLAEEAVVWEASHAIAHFILTECACGAKHSRFNSWYKILEHRKTSATRMVQCTGHEGLPTAQYSTQESVEVCEDCLRLSAIPEAKVKDFPILASLGQALPCDDSQMLLDMLTSEAATDLLLQELEGEGEGEGEGEANV